MENSNLLNGFQKQLVCIQYPGTVNDEIKAIETLGGLSGISQAYSKNNRLQLRFRPKDPYCKAAYSHTYSCTGVLLKIKVKKKKNSGEIPEVKLSEVVGVINVMHKFETLCDFQYLPMTDKDDASPTGKNILNELQPKGIQNIEWLDASQRYFLLPPIFSRIDCPQKYIFYLNSPNEQSDITSLFSKDRKIRCAYSIFITFNHTDMTPTVPKKNAIECLSNVSSVAIEKVRKIFEEKPMWSRLSLLYLTKLSPDTLRNILVNIAYQYMNGPWRLLWTKLGYDPRKDPQSRIYQIIDFRVRNTGGFKSVLKAYRTKSRCSMLNKSNIHKTEGTNVEFPNESKIQNLEESVYVLKPGMLPPRRQMFYQYCNLKIPEIEEMLSKLGEVLPGSSCDERRGWMPYGFDNQCRNIITSYVLEKMREISAQNVPFDDKPGTSKITEDGIVENFGIEEEDSESDDDDENKNDEYESDDTD
ncbi:general transcription factor IIIC subunit l(2)37Cd [Arctopsyche grandis]|uniref:general transcription factor IIIC subunit l(2)37Cd n=1 Tax=Arctopsyche grandis TaxID=121162 RepID=UPI00406D8C6F